MQLAHRRLHTFLVSAALLALLATSWAIYQPAMPGFFMLDDFDNLSALEDGVTDWDSLQNYLERGNAGPLGRPISKLTFLLNDNAWPSEPDSFKRVNLLLHLLTGLLVFIVCRLLLRHYDQPRSADWVALAAASLWLVHPLQVSTVMYVVQRMAQLSSLFVLAGVASHLYLRLNARLRPAARMAWMTLSLGVFTLLAAFSKESGVLLPVFLLVTEFTLLTGLPASPIYTWWRRLFLGLPTLVLLAYLAYVPRWLPSYEKRGFTLAERLLTEPVVLLDYLSTLVTFQVSGLGLFQDDFPVYSSLLDPVPAIAAAVIAGAGVLAVTFRKQAPLLSFGVLWFLVGHMLESTTVALELYFEHRNYLPMVGPILALTASGYYGLRRISRDLGRVAPIAAISLIGIAATITYGYAGEWGSHERLLPLWAAEHPDSPRAQRTYAQLLASKGLPRVALDELDAAYKRFPRDLSMPVISIDISCAFDLPLRYDLGNLAQRAKDHRWTDGLRPALQSLYGRVLETHCRDKTDQLHKLARALPELQGGEHRRSGIASFFVLDGNLYLEEGDGYGAYRSFRTVNQLAPSSDSALRLANLFILSGNYDRARRALLIAQDRERATKEWYLPDRSDMYAEKLLLIDSLEEKSKTEK